MPMSHFLVHEASTQLSLITRVLVYAGRSVPSLPWSVGLCHRDDVYENGREGVALAPKEE